MDNMESQLKEYTCTESAQGKTLLDNETLMHLEAAKRTVKSLEVDASKVVHGHYSAALEAEVSFLRSEVGRLRCILEFAETKLLEEEIQNIVKIRSAYEREDEIRNEFKRLNERIAELNGDLVEKERAIQSMSKENEIVKYIGKAMMKLEIVTVEAERSKQNEERMAEQLEAVQAEMYETNEEMRRLRVQSEQWRRAAEAAAAAVISSRNNGQLTDRSLSLDSRFNPPMIRYSTFVEESDDGSQRKKSANMLEKIKGLWKKTTK